MGNMDSWVQEWLRWCIKHSLACSGKKPRLSISLDSLFTSVWAATRWCRSSKRLCTGPKRFVTVDALLKSPGAKFCLENFVLHLFFCNHYSHPSVDSKLAANLDSFKGFISSFLTKKADLNQSQMEYLSFGSIVLVLNFIRLLSEERDYETAVSHFKVRFPHPGSFNFILVVFVAQFKL